MALLEKESRKNNSGYVVNFSLADQTETPEFKRWFDDSMVVDEHGKPLEEYNGIDQLNLFLQIRR